MPRMKLTVPLLYFIHNFVYLAVSAYSLLVKLDLILDLLLGPRHGKLHSSIRLAFKHPSFLDRATVDKFRLRYVHWVVSRLWLARIHGLTK